MERILHLAGRDITTAKASFVMGIVNCTPDSFWEGGRGGAERAMRLVEEGADILDIGGESTRPGASYIDAQEEIKRVIPVVREVRRNSNIPISIDTRKYEVISAALNEGADILNDVSALEDDEKAGGRIVPLITKCNIPIILMHKRGIPAIMQENTKYSNVFDEVSGYLVSRAKYAMDGGVDRSKIIVDPGIGFAKDSAANAQLVTRCKELCGGEYPVLVGLSRKTCIGEATGRAVAGRLAGSVAGACVAAMRGAMIVRVHDVAQSVDAMKVVALLGGVEKV